MVAATLAGLLRIRSEERPDDPALTYLADGEVIEFEWSYRELAARAAAIAMALRRLLAPGARVLVTTTEEPWFIAALFGCAAARVVAVPCPPAARGARLDDIAADCGAAGALTTTDERERLAQRALRGLALWCIDELAGGEGGALDGGAPDEVALIQYTSGSTRTPRGIVVRHRHLLANQQMIAAGFGHDRESTFAGWLPLFHDMGLIGNVLQPLFLGARCVLMPPRAFLERPIRWLRAIDRFRAHTAGAPSFAYRLCVDRTSADERAGLDLSSWRVAYNGAEPVRAEIIEAFAATFEPHGFHRASMYPCYGLAEATLFVAGPPPRRGPRIIEVSSSGLIGGVAREAAAGEERRTLVGCGSGWLSTRITIRDPEGAPVAENLVGEICVSGDAVTVDQPWLCTGDLGFLRDGELYVTGRSKDLIIVRGRNHHPHDLEWAAERAHPAVRGAAAFAAEGDDGEHAVIVAEVERGDDADYPAIARAIAAAVARTAAIVPRTVALVRPGVIARTTSGKVRRARCRDDLAANALPCRLVWRAAAADADADAHQGDDPVAVVRALVARATGDVVDDHVSLHTIGIDSMGLVSLVHEVEDRLGVAIAIARVAERPTIAAIAALIVAAGGDLTAADAPATGGGLSRAESAIWLDHVAAPESRAYHAAHAFRLPAAIDATTVEAALAVLTDRHEALRTAIVLEGEQPVRHVAASVTPGHDVIDARGWDDGRVARAVTEAAAGGFELERAPLVRFLSFRRADDLVLAVIGHHVIADRWSLDTAVRELRELCAAHAEQRLPRLEPHPVQARQLVRAFEAAQVDAIGLRWRARLAGWPVSIDLPLDHARPAQRRGRAATVRRSLGPALSAQLRRIAADHDASRAAVLLAAYQRLLHEWTGQPKLLIGVPSACRAGRERRDAIACLVNLVVVRSRHAPGDSFSTTLGRARDELREAGSHDDDPFDCVVAAAGLGVREPSRPPLVQAVFVVHTEIDGWSELDVDPPGTAFELTLTIREHRGVVAAAFTYDAALFERSSIERLADRYVEILAQRPRHLAPPAASLIERIDEVARARPEHTALIDDAGRLTYRDLWQRAGRIAAALRARGIGPEHRVAINCDRGRGAIIGVLGIMRAGAAYAVVPETTAPARRDAMLADAGITAVIDGGEPDADADAELPTPALTRRSLAYVIFTSGTTGRPKPVAIEHGHVLDLLDAALPRLGAGADDVWTQFHSLSFDFSVWELFGALTTGGAVVPIDQKTAWSPADLLDRIATTRATIVSLVPSAFRAVVLTLGDRAPSATLRALVFGGEPLDPDTLRRWVARHGTERPRLVNMYGITETTVHVTWHQLGPDDVAEPFRQRIGRPLPHLRVYLLGADGEPVAPGMRGEIHVGGTSLARGYLGRGSLTAERFVPDPFEPGARLYRSGDLARVLADGTLEFLGRTDAQVQIRGHRVEPHAIEVALRARPEVGDAVCVASDDEGSGRRLVAYVEPATDAVASAVALQRALRDELPAYMVPLVVVLERLPRTAGGKPDRGALPSPPRRRTLEREPEPPATAAEQTLADIMAAVLGLDQVGVTDDFYALGGDSIRALRVAGRARTAGLEITVEAVLRHASVRALAAVVAPPSSGAAPRLAFDGVAAAVRELLPPDAVDACPATALQQLLRTHSMGSAGYEVYVSSFRLRLAFDEPALRRAVATTVRRHAMLRTTLVAAGGEIWQVAHAEGSIPVEIIDLRSEADPEAAARALMARQRRRRFDWSALPLFDLHALRETDDVVRLVITEPFLDGWSVAQLVSELVQALNGHHGPAVVDDLASIAELVRRERAALEDERRFWDVQLAGLPARQLDLVRPATAAARRSRRVTAERSGLAEALEEISRRHDVAIKHLVLAAHLRALGHAAGRTRVVTAVMSNGRPETPGGDDAIGLYLNSLPLGIGWSGSTWIDLARAVRSWELAVWPHRFTPYVTLEQRAGGALSEVAFNFTRFHPLAERMSHALLDWEATDQTYFPVTVQLNLDERGALRLAIDHDETRIDARDAERLLAAHLAAIDSLVMAPLARIDGALLLQPRERAWLETRHGAAVTTDEPRTLDARWRDAAIRWPERIAIRDGERAVTYRELAVRVDRIACGLRARGIGCEARVGVSYPRGLEYAAAVLGILAAGAAWIAFDLDQPVVRNQAIAADAGIELVLGSAPAPGVAAVLLDEVEVAGEPPIPPAQPDRLAYVIYTSGSTGQPKGVMGTHRAMSQRIAWMERELPLAADDVIALRTPTVFVDAVWELLGPLCAGAALAVVSRDDGSDLHRLAGRLAAADVTRLVVVPSLLRGLIEHLPPDGLPALRVCVSSGEALHGGLAAQVRSRLPGARLLNLYGSAEVAADVTWHDASAPAAATVPCGVPIDHARVWLRDETGELAAPGAIGEVTVGGAPLARGYLGRPAATAAAFVPDPDGPPGARMYLTGDLGRWSAEGWLQLLGRADRQVKIRGQRVEPDEVAAWLHVHPAIGSAACRVWPDERGEPALAAYVVVRAATRLRPDEVRDWLAARVPAVFVPRHVVVLDQLPRLPSGKVAVAALPRPPSPARDHRGSDVPTTVTEQQVLRLWSEVLGTDAVSTRDRFLELGGHSLLALRLLARIRDELGVTMPPRALFGDTTVGSLAAAIDVLRASGGEPSTPTLQPFDHAVPRLTAMQENLWFLARRRPDDPAYHMSASLRLRGRLDVAALERALAAVLGVHDGLRLRISEDGGEPRALYPRRDFTLTVEERPTAPPERDGVARALAAADLARTFDPELGPLYRFHLVHFDAADHALVATLHHLIADEWSLGVIAGDVGAGYNASRVGGSPALPAAPSPAMYGAWEAAQLERGAWDDQLDHWRAQLRGARATRLPASESRLEGRPAAAGLELALSPESTLRLRARASASGATTFMAVVAAFAAVIRARLGDAELVIGTDLAHRNPGHDRMVAPLVNQAVLRVALHGHAGFADAIAEVRASVTEALAHAEVPYPRVREAVAAASGDWSAPLFHIKLVMQNAPFPPWRLDGVAVEPIAVPPMAAKFDLLFNLWDDGAVLRGVVEVDSARHRASDVEDLIAELTAAIDHGGRRDELSWVELIEHLVALRRARQARRGEEQLASERDLLGRSLPRPMPLAGDD